MTIVGRVIEKLGGVAATARAFGVKHPTVIGWRERGVLPAERLTEAARLTGIPAAELRPDLAEAFALRSAPAEGRS
jgi:DNA-binding transcriptional regulator YdaS (Cro superfamily)